MGSVWWEIFQPLDEDGIFARFLEEKGEGIHHIAVKAVDYEGALGREAEPLPLTGSFMDVKVSYLPTSQTLGVLLEVFSGFPEGDKG